MNPNSQYFILGSSGQLGYVVSEMSVQPLEYGGDIRDKIALQEFIMAHRIAGARGYLINCAAKTNVDWCETHAEEAIEVNAHAVQNLLEIANEFDLTIIHISTNFVFNTADLIAIPDTCTECYAVNEYGRSKLLAENYLLNAPHVKSYIVRTSWLYSKRGPFLKNVLGTMQANKPIFAATDIWSVPTSTTWVANYIWRIIAALEEEEILPRIHHCVPLLWASQYEYLNYLGSLFHAYCLLPNESVPNIVPMLGDQIYSKRAVRPKHAVLQPSTSLDLNPSTWQLELAIEIKNMEKSYI